MSLAFPIIFDRPLLRARRLRALRLGPETFLLDRVAADFADRLALVLRRFVLAADIGTPTAALRTALSASDRIGTLIAAVSADGRAGRSRDRSVARRGR